MDTDLAQRIRKARLALHLSVRELSAISGVAVGTIHRIENGEGVPFDHTLAKLAQHIGLSVEDLVA